MGDVHSSVCLDKQNAPDGRDLSLQALAVLWLSVPPRVRRTVLRGLWNQEQRLRQRAATGQNDAERAWASELTEPTKVARWLLRGISKALDPSYDLRADGTANAETFAVGDDLPQLKRAGVLAESVGRR